MVRGSSTVKKSQLPNGRMRWWCVGDGANSESLVQGAACVPLELPVGLSLSFFGGTQQAES